MTEKGKSIIRNIYRQLDNIEYGEITGDFLADDVVQQIMSMIAYTQKLIVDKIKELENEK